MSNLNFLKCSDWQKLFFPFEMTDKEKGTRQVACKYLHHFICCYDLLYFQMVSERSRGFVLCVWCGGWGGGGSRDLRLYWVQCTPSVTHQLLWICTMSLWIVCIKIWFRRGVFFHLYFICFARTFVKIFIGNPKIYNLKLAKQGSFWTEFSIFLLNFFYKK